ncbi:Acylamino-acid-releasing enzyme [Thelohanellus kitauei]|uniref:Acylamino-acid-releasing enzyme n=1 Tax=Thelohanellus kitauei TaxID=669202 RepID=A0A0C2MJQ1_THEKT|nr:Acylamino-acid-releasing enzyme [Thelohanellus kitauei]
MMSGLYSEEEFKKTWSRLCYSPKPITSKFLEVGQVEDTAAISTIWSTPNLVTKKNDCHEIVTSINIKTGKITESQACVTQIPIAESWSRDRSLVAKVFSDKSKPKTVYYIEIWSKNTLKHQISLADQTLHEGLFGKSCVSCSDGSIDSIVWSSDCSKLYYLAETHKNEEKSFELVEHFGEGFSNVFKPQIFCLEIDSCKVSKAVELPEHLYPDKLLYNDNHLYFLATRFPDIKHSYAMCKNHPYAVFITENNSIFYKSMAQSESINGHIGRQDVDDVHLTLLEVCQFETLSTEAVYCGGGSYGGFLSTHLVGQYPDFYKGCFLRNPLTNFLTQFWNSDLHEYTVTLAGLPKPTTLSLKAEDIAELYTKSPLYYSDQIKCPVILFLGSEDKRVPMEQGLQIYRNMKSRKQDVTVFIYKDGHALQSVEAATSMMCEILKFIEESLLQKHNAYIDILNA